MINKKSWGEKIFDSANVIFMILLAITMLYPFIYLLNLSLSSPEGALKGGFFLIPNGFSTAAYERVLTSASIWNAFKNSILVTVAGTICSVFFTATMAYSLSKKFLPGKTVFTLMVVFTMLFSGGIIPTYLVVKNLGLMNSRLALIMPTLIMPFNLIITRNFFQNMPDELEEAATIDGAGTYRIFFQIVFPLSLPVIATISLWYAVMYWNDFFLCLIYIQERSKIVLQLLLREIVMLSQVSEFLPGAEEDTVDVPEAVKAATIIVATLPILFVYPFIQKYFVKGVMVGSLKG